MTDSNSILNERIRSLEVANDYHRESLTEISNTLKEVVKVQSMLASQREEIIKIAESIETISKTIHDHDKKLTQYRLTLEEIKKDFDELNKDFGETKTKTDNNTKFVKIVTGVITLVALPIVIPLLSKLLSGII